MWKLCVPQKEQRKGDMVVAAYKGEQTDAETVVMAIVRTERAAKGVEKGREE